MSRGGGIFEGVNLPIILSLSHHRTTGDIPESTENFLRTMGSRCPSVRSNGTQQVSTDILYDLEKSIPTYCTFGLVLGLGLVSS